MSHIPHKRTQISKDTNARACEDLRLGTTEWTPIDAFRTSGIRCET